MAHDYFSSVVITNESSYSLVIKRTEEPYAGRYMFPRTVAQLPEENYMKAAARLVAGEMQVPVYDVNLLGVMDAPIEGYEVPFDMAFFTCTVSNDVNLDAMLEAGYELKQIREIPAEEWVPECAMFIESFRDNINEGEEPHFERSH